MTRGVGDVSPSERRVRAWLAVTAVVAWVAGAAAAAATFRGWLVPDWLVDLPGLDEVLAPAAFGVAHTAVIMAGELGLRRRLGRVRSASLVRRRGLALADGWVLRLGVVGLLLLVVVVAVGAALSGSDGETLAHGDPGAYPVLVSDVTVGVFPGPRYGVTLVFGAGLLVAMLWAVLRLVEKRPSIGDAETDLRLRRLTARRAVRALSASVLVTAAVPGFLGAVAVAESYPDGLLRLAGLWLSAGFVLLAGAAVLMSVLPVSLPRGRPGQKGE
ncbi:hypothetical protein FBY24_2315 [Cellulomonas sp. SLBN-39]|nr:hypothetical protein FBY24_2315 [Cellulomonas sp. SLBN-39]